MGNVKNIDGKMISFADAIEAAIAQEMAKDANIVIFGEDVELLRINLLTRFGFDRVKNTPISESAFLGAAVTAAMAGLRPIVEIMLVDFIGVCADGILNHAAKNYFFSGRKWNVPMVIRTSCGGGYGDAGQHEQSLWGWLAHIPGISVVVPSNPIDAGNLMVSSIRHDHPVIYLEHKMLSDYWLDYMGIGGRDTVSFDVPKKGVEDRDPGIWDPVPFGKARIMREGDDVTLISVAVGVHRAMEAAEKLAAEGISAEVIDLRFISPLDEETISASVEKTGKVAVIDEDYERFGLSGEIAAILAEREIPFKYARVCLKDTIPFARAMEDDALPNVPRIMEAVKKLTRSV